MSPTEINGLPEKVADSRGEAVWHGTSTAWGRSQRESVHAEWDVPQNLRFQGQYLDRETGLHYNIFRYYDPTGSCYTQMDPIGLNGGINLYAYVKNPFTRIDPLGLTPCAVSNQKANRLLDSGETKVTVRSRSDAEQLFMDRYLDHNYKNMTVSQVQVLRI